MFALIWCCLKLRSYSRLGHNFKVNLWWLLPCYLDPRPPQWGWQMGPYHLFSNSRYSDASGAAKTAIFLRLMLMRLQLSSGSVALLSYIRLHHQINHVWFLLLPHQVEKLRATLYFQKTNWWFLPIQHMVLREAAGSCFWKLLPIVLCKSFCPFLQNIWVPSSASASSISSHHMAYGLVLPEWQVLWEPNYRGFEVSIFWNHKVDRCSSHFGLATVSWDFELFLSWMTKVT